MIILIVIPIVMLLVPVSIYGAVSLSFIYSYFGG